MGDEGICETALLTIAFEFSFRIEIEPTERKPKTYFSINKRVPVHLCPNE